MGGRAGGGANGGMGSGSRGDSFNGIESRISGKIHLQGIGKQPAVKASDLKAGDKVMWNYGSTSTVSSVTPKGKTQLTVSFESGGSRVFSGSRLVGVVTKDNAWQVRT